MKSPQSLFWLRHATKRVLPVVAIISLVALQGSASAQQTIDVFLIGGQSNGDGRATVSAPDSTSPSDLEADDPAVYNASLTDNIPYYYGTTKTTDFAGAQGAEFGPEVTFGLSMKSYEASQGNSIALIKYSPGGTNLYSQWAAGGTATTTGDGPMYQTFQSDVAKDMAALATANPGATIVIAGMIWMQGESDAVINSGTDESLLYQTNLTNFIDDVRLTYGANLPFVIGELSSKQSGTGPTAQRNNVRAAQVAVAGALPDSGIVNTDNFPLNTDALHFSDVGQVDLGNGFATQMQDILAAPEPNSYLLLLSALPLLLWVGRRARPRLN